MKFSLLKTLANKYRSKIGRIIKKFGVNGEIAVKYQTKKGPQIRYFYNEGFRRNTLLDTKAVYDIDVLPNTTIYGGRTSLVERLMAEVCEYCGATGVEIHMHHVRKLKDLKGKKAWEKLMIARQRKTLALCVQCHVDLHQGRLD